MKRFLKGTFWNLVITGLGIAFYALIPQYWPWLPVLCAIEYVAIAKLREKLRF